MTSNRQHDVIVVGGRCAGAATALLLARQGWDVGLYERNPVVADTVSTHGLTRAGVIQLHRWGLLDEVLASGVPAVKTLAFVLGDNEMRRPVAGADPVDIVIAPRRPVLDRVLLDAAAAAGVTIARGATVTGVERDAAGRVTGVSGRRADGNPFAAAARVVVGADGRTSRVARAVGAAVIDQRPSRCGTYYSYFTGLGDDAFEFHVGATALVGVFPTNDDRSCVWLWGDAMADGWTRRVAGRPAAALVAEIGREHPRLAARLDPAGAPAVRGAARIANHVRRSGGPGWALVGDAVAYRDPITGHGITDALRDAELLARALHGALADEVDEADALAAYEADRAALGDPVFDLTCELAAYAEPHRFLGLGQQIGTALEAEAQALEPWPAPAGGPGSAFRPRRRALVAPT
jgi:2-polyprenyl-6-methoxyphenol hydroxylase-like FAD-dependent oxidoreductase